MGRLLPPPALLPVPLVKVVDDVEAVRYWVVLVYFVVTDGVDELPM